MIDCFAEDVTHVSKGAACGVKEYEKFPAYWNNAAQGKCLGLEKACHNGDDGPPECELEGGTSEGAEKVKEEGNGVD